MVIWRNMKLEQQVTSLELSKKLKALGVKQESLYWWQEQMTDYKWNGEFKLKDKQQDFRPQRDSSAFTVAELWEQIIEQPIFTPHIPRWNGVDWEVPLMQSHDGAIDFRRANTMANAYGEMLIYLIENDLLKTNK